MNKANQIRSFDKQAVKYEKMRKKPGADYAMRRDLLASANGRILELSVGAGANFSVYPKDVHVTAVDFSSAMINKAREAAEEAGISAEFIVGDIETLDFPEQSFDTVVSTLSICSYAIPVSVMNNMNKWCKPNGHILMLEHGISKSKIYSWVQKKGTNIWFSWKGCHLNRDILDMVSKSNLKITRQKSYMLQSVHLIWAKPSSNSSKEGVFH